MTTTGDQIAAVHEAASQGHNAGLCIIPPAEDGTKRPLPNSAGAWDPFKRRRPTDNEMREWYPGRIGLGVITGPVSGHVECWDFDDRPTYEGYVAAARDCGLGNVVERIEEGYCDDTPGGGVRWLVRNMPGVERTGNIKLARRPKSPEERRHPNDKVKTLIELPLYTIVAPSNGRVHPTGRPYTRRDGGFDTIASYSTEEREEMLALARSFDAMPRASEGTGAKNSAEKNRPGDNFERRTTWPEVLEPPGWKRAFEREGTTYWRRPGKNFGVSATTNFGGSDLLHVFTSSTQFEMDTSYTRFGAFAVLEHGGDFHAAAKALAAQGYGDDGTDKPKRTHDDYGGVSADNDDNESAQRIILIPFESIRLGRTRRHLIKGLIPRIGLTVIWGAPKCGKSFWTFDLVMHVALGWEYRDRRVHRGPVVYCAFEGQTGVEARVEAYRQKFLAEQADSPPFFLVPVMLNLVRDQKNLIAAIKRTIRDVNPVAVVLDTLNRSIQGSESSDEDMSAYVKAADAICECFSCAVLIVHHCGHAGNRPRGHSSLLGSAEAVIAIRKDAAGQIIAELEMMKDGAQGDVLTSQLEVIDVGTDEDSELIRSCVVLAAGNTASRDPRRPRHDTAAGKALNELEHLVIAKKGEVSRGHKRIPDGVTLIKRADWQAACFETYISNGKPKNEERAFHRAVKKLSAVSLIGARGDVVWLIPQTTTDRLRRGAKGQ